MSASNRPPPLDILSAASFPDTLADDRPLSYQSSAAPLYGGLLVCAESDEARPNARPHQQMSNVKGSKSHESHVQPKKKAAKRSKSQAANAENGVDNGAKKRGRPRVDTADETAAERRRTQIRLAQRAYRLRKESVISSLNRRVAELEKIVDEMSQTFLAFNDQAMSSDVLSSQPELAQHLHHATERFLALAKDANSEAAQRDGGSDDDEEANAAESQQATSSGEPQQQQPSPPPPTQASQAAPIVVSQPLPQSQPPNPDRAMTPRTPVGLKNPGDDNPDGLVLQPDHALTSTPMNSLYESYDWSFLDSMFTSGLDMFQAQSIRPPFRTTPQSINSLTPSSYAFSETTFARRLHRSCLTKGYYLLSDPSSHPSHLHRKFRLSFQFASRSQLANAFHYLLQKGVDESLEFWNKPFFTIGGAGTHFPRKDELGIAVYPPNMHAPQKALPALSAELPEGAPPYRCVEDAVEAIGLGGQCFDCNDVEGYLLSHGISLDGGSSCVELPTSSSLFRSGVYASPTSSTTDNFSDGPTHLTTQVTTDPPEPAISNPNTLSYQLLPSCFYSSQNQPAAQALDLLGINREALSEIGHYDNMVPPQSMQHAGMAPSRTAFIDVDSFVEELTGVAVCFGRAPAFRRRDVEAALAASISHAS